MSETKTFILKTTKDLSLITDPIYQYFDKVKDEPLQVVVGRQSAFDKKTHPQLKYYHGVVLPTLKSFYLKANPDYYLQNGKFQEITDFNMDLALKFKAGYGEADLMIVIIDGRKIPIPYFKAKSKAEATFLDLVKLIDCAREWAIELGGEIPEPTEAYEN